MIDAKDRQETGGVQPKNRFGPAANLVAVLAGLSISVLLGEGLMRFVPAVQPYSLGWVGQHQNRPSRNFIADPDTGWRMRPNHEFSWITDGLSHIYRSNSQGFRAEADFNLSDARKHIVLVGDSFTWGSGVEYGQTFGALLERESGQRVVWNLAMPGFAVDQVWLSTRHQAMAMKPDLIIAGLVNADFMRSQESYRHTEGFNKPAFKLVQGRLTRRTIEKPPGPFLRFLERHSCIWSAVRSSDRWLGYRFPVGNFWNLNRAILDQLQADCKQRQVPLLFVYIPTKDSPPFPMIRKYLRASGANLIDLTEHHPPRSIYFVRDGHLSPEGHRFVANLIEGWLHEKAPQL